MKIFVLFLLLLSDIALSYGANIDKFELPDLGPFTGLEFTVGYIKKEDGQRFLIVESPDGTKLIKTVDRLQELSNPYNIPQRRKK